MTVGRVSIDKADCIRYSISNPLPKCVRREKLITDCLSLERGACSLVLRLKSILTIYFPDQICNSPYCP